MRKNFKKKKPVTHVHNFIKNAELMNDYLANGYTKINIGGGPKNLRGYINIDFVKHEDVKLQIAADINDLSFIPSASLTHVHSCHALEHIDDSELSRHLTECMRVLKMGGVISVRCPNALGVAYGFFFGQTPEKEREKFVELGYPEDEVFYDPKDGWYFQDLWGAYHWWYACTGSIVNEHKNLITPSKLINHIKGCGFSVLKITEPETSNIILVAEK